MKNKYTPPKAFAELLKIYLIATLYFWHVHRNKVVVLTNNIRIYDGFHRYSVARKAQAYPFVLIKLKRINRETSNFQKENKKTSLVAIVSRTQFA